MEIVWDVPQFCLYLLWFAADNLSTHSYDAQTEVGKGIGDVGGFDGAVFNSVYSHRFHKLGISRVASHSLGLAGRNGVFDYMLGEAFVTLADGLNHGHGVHGLRVAC